MNPKLIEVLRLMCDAIDANDDVDTANCLYQARALIDGLEEQPSCLSASKDGPGHCKSEPAFCVPCVEEMCADAVKRAEQRPPSEGEDAAVKQIMRKHPTFDALVCEALHEAHHLGFEAGKVKGAREPLARAERDTRTAAPAPLTRVEYEAKRKELLAAKARCPDPDVCPCQADARNALYALDARWREQQEQLPQRTCAACCEVMPYEAWAKAKDGICDACHKQEAKSLADASMAAMDKLSREHPFDSANAETKVELDDPLDPPTELELKQLRNSARMPEQEQPAKEDAYQSAYRFGYKNGNDDGIARGRLLERAELRKKAEAMREWECFSDENKGLLDYVFARVFGEVAV